MKTSGLDLPDNCTLIFHANGIKVRVSLNIPRELRKFIPKERLHKADEFFVYWIQKDIPLEFCSVKNIKDTYEHLLNITMQNIRMRKQEFLQHQINKLQQIQPQLEF